MCTTPRSLEAILADLERNAQVSRSMATAQLEASRREWDITDSAVTRLEELDPVAAAYLRQYQALPQAHV